LMVAALRSQWYQVENSYFFLVRLHREGWQLTEWFNGGEVHLRQVYAAEPAQFYAVAEEPSGGRTILDRFPRLQEAQRAVEAHFQARMTPENLASLPT